MLTRVVIVLIVKVEFNVCANRKQPTGIERSGAPFVVLTLVEGLGSEIRDEMVGADRKRSVNRQFVPIAPGKFTIFPIELRAVAIGQGKAGFHRIVQGHGSYHLVFEWRIRNGDATVAAFQNQKS